MGVRPLLLADGSLYSADETRMNDYPRTSEDIRKIRDRYLGERPGNLEFLLEKQE